MRQSKNVKCWQRKNWEPAWYVRSQFIPSKQTESLSLNSNATILIVSLSLQLQARQTARQVNRKFTQIQPRFPAAQPSSFDLSLDFSLPSYDSNANDAQIRDFAHIILLFDKVLTKFSGNFALEVTSTELVISECSKQRENQISSGYYPEADSAHMALILARGASFSY